MGDAQVGLDIIIRAINQGDATFDEVMSKLKQMKVAWDTTLKPPSEGGASQFFEKLTQSLQGASGVLPGVAGELGKAAAAGGAMGVAMYGAQLAVDTLVSSLRAIPQALDEGLKAYTKADLAQKQLSLTWKNAGRSMPMEEIDGFIKKLAHLTKYDDDQLVAAAKRLAIFPDITGKNLEKALKVSADLASFKGMDVGSAAQTIGRAAGGQFRRLEMMVGKFSAATKESKNFGAVLDELDKKLGGAAGVELETYGGKLQKISNVSEELRKRFGEMLEPAANLWAGQKLSWMQSIDEQLDKSVKGGKLKEVQESLQNLVRIFTFPVAGTDWLEKALEAAHVALKAMSPHLTLMWKILEAVGKGKAQGPGHGQPEEAPPEGYINVPSKPGETGLQKEAREIARAAKESGLVLQESLANPEVWGSIDEEAQKLGVHLLDLYQTVSRMTAALADIAEGDQWIPDSALSAAEQYEAVIERVNQAITGGAKLDWKSELVKAEDFWKRVQDLATLAGEHEKTVAWENARSKEEAERSVFAIDSQMALQRTAIAQRQHDETLALKRKEWAEEEGKIKSKGRYTDEVSPEEKVKRDAELQQELKKTKEKQITEEIQLEQKLSDAIKAEMTSRESALQKEYEKRADIQQQIKALNLDTQKMVTDVAMAAGTEWEKLGSKFQEARDTLKRAVDEMPSAPQKALELAKSAQQAFAALKQDVAGLEANLRSTTEMISGLETQIRQASMNPFQKREDEKREIQRLMAESRSLKGQGLTSEAEEQMKNAARKAAGLASPAEGQSPYAAQAEASTLLAQIKPELLALARDRVDKAKEMNEQLKKAISDGGKVANEALNKSLSDTNSHINALIVALDALRQQMGGVKTAEPSGSARSVAGLSGAGAGGAGGAAGANQMAPWIAAGQSESAWRANNYGVPEPSTIGSQGASQGPSGAYEYRTPETKVPTPEEFDKAERAAMAKMGYEWTKGTAASGPGTSLRNIEGYAGPGGWASLDRMPKEQREQFRRGAMGMQLADEKLAGLRGGTWSEDKDDEYKKKMRGLGLSGTEFPGGPGENTEASESQDRFAEAASQFSDAARPAAEKLATFLRGCDDFKGIVDRMDQTIDKLVAASESQSNLTINVPAGGSSSSDYSSPFAPG